MKLDFLYFLGRKIKLDLRKLICTQNYTKIRHRLNSSGFLLNAEQSGSHGYRSGQEQFSSGRYDSYSVCVKQLFSVKLGAPYKAINLDDHSDAIDMHYALAKWTKQLLLPIVFIGGNHIGDCHQTWRLHKEGKLVPLLAEAQVDCPQAQAQVLTNTSSEPPRKKKWRSDCGFITIQVSPRVM